MPHRLRRICAISLVCGLSCVVRGPFTPDALSEPEPAAAPRAEGVRDYQVADLDEAARRALVEEVRQLFSRYQMRLSPVEVARAAEATVRESARHRLALDLVLAVIRVESGYNNFARSHAGAIGLMQVMPPTGKRVAEMLGIKWHGPNTLFDPVTNIRIGTAYLAKLYGRYGSWDRALAAYNWGPGRIDKRLRSGRSLPVRYVAQVRDARALQATLLQ